MRMRRFVIFPYYLINDTIFGGGGKLLNTKCVFWFSLQLLSEIFLILRKTGRDMIINVYRSSCRVPVILVRIQWNWNFLNIFSRNPQISNFMKICPVGAQALHAGGRADITWHDVTKLLVAFRSFASAPKYDIYTSLGFEGLFLLHPTTGSDGAGSMFFFQLIFKDST
jgi:hypothetical protein